MNELMAEDLVRLEREVGAPRLSLFLPLSPGSLRASKLRIGAKNALLRTDRALRAARLPGLDSARLLGLVEEALHQPRSPNPDHLGLALFADPSSVRQYHVPVRVPELAVVGDRFMVAPALPAMSTPGRVLPSPLGQNEIPLFLGTSLTLGRVKTGTRRRVARDPAPLLR
jgi:hypothetical protein